MLQAVEKANVTGGYLEDLVYSPKALKSLKMITGRRGRRNCLGKKQGNTPRPAQRLVLGYRKIGRRRHY